NCTNFTSNSLFNQHFAVKTTAPLQVEKGIIKLHILVDQSSVEVFANDGQRAMSVVTFPGDQQKGIELFAQGGQAHLISFKGWTMKSIWK
ncbi:MAG TPA: GH32 C-terminal domain-containing protein, partial [Flavisolibacter sp.]|nr:GH32 C-terminal domain-containing protein [Flavisolibacter sp.]